MVLQVGHRCNGPPGRTSILSSSGQDINVMVLRKGYRYNGPPDRILI